MKEPSLISINEPSSKTVARELMQLPVLVAALGYLVDMYDLFLFSIVRVPSLRSLNLSGDSIMKDGIMLLNLQMAGMLIGGIVWGIMGDKKGRLSVLFVLFLFIRWRISGTVLCTLSKLMQCCGLLRALVLQVNWEQG